MAAKTFYLKDAIASGSGYLSLQDGGSAPTQARISTGWVVGTLAATRYARMDAQTERASTAHTTTPVQPDGAPDNTLGDCFRSENPISGTFANANWSLSFQVEGETRTTSTHDGILRIRVWKSANADGSSPTELTSATLTTSQYTNLANSAYQTLTATWSPGAAISLNNEYLFIQVAHQLDGAGGNANSDTHLAVGSSCSVVTSNFVHDLTATGIAAGAPTVGTPAVGQVHALVASGITTGAPTLGSPALTQPVSLIANDLTAGAPALGTPAIGQVHALASGELAAGAPTAGAPEITQTHVLNAPALAAGAPILDNPAMGQMHDLEAAGIAAGSPALGAPALTQAHALTANDLATGAPTLGTPTLTENQEGVDHLVADDLSMGALVLGAPAIGQIHALTAGELAAGAPVLDSPAVMQFHALVAMALSAGAPSLGNPILSEQQPGGQPDYKTGLYRGLFKGAEKEMVNS